MSDILTANTLNRVINNSGTRKVLAQTGEVTSQPGEVVTLLTTDANTQYTVNDINLQGIGKDVIIKINDSVVMVGESDEDDLIASGDLFMDVNSTMTATIVGDKPRFDGMHFCNTSGPSATGLEVVTANGIDAKMDDGNYGPRRISARNHVAEDACSTIVDGKIRHYRIWDSVYLAAYSATGQGIKSRGQTQIQFGITAGDGWLWGCNSGSTSTFQRFNPKTLQRTIQHVYNESYLGKGNNQGSYWTYYYDEAAGYGKIFGKVEGGSSTFSVIHLDKTQQNSSGQWYCEQFNNGEEYITGSGVLLSGLSVSSYSDGACIVKTRTGGNYLVEIGSGAWTYLNLDTGELTNIGEGSSSSTEYGTRAAEVAPGYVVCFGEQSDRVMTFDLNEFEVDGTTPRTPNRTGNFTGNDHGWSYYYEYSDRSSFTGWLTKALPVTHTTYITGVEYSA